MKIAKIAKSRITQCALSLILGGVITALFMPEMIKKVHITSTETVEKEVVKELWRDRIKIEQVKVVKYKTTYPDGKIVESEIYESNTEQSDRIRKEERDRYEQLIAKAKTTEIHTNPKKFNLSFGISPPIFDKTAYIATMSARLWGPVTIGLAASSTGLIAPTLGITF